MPSSFLTTGHFLARTYYNSKMTTSQYFSTKKLTLSHFDFIIKIIQRNQGIEKTSISDIAKKAGVAKGTFYLYFADKYEIRDRLIARTASRLFHRAHKALETADIPEFEDKIIFIVDYVLNAMQKNKLILRFISKNLSWGIFRQAITNNTQDDEGEILAYFSNILLDHPTIKLRAPETMLFLIIELASSTSYSTILDNDPMSFEELKPYLNESIRAIIRNHIIEDTAEN